MITQSSEWQSLLTHHASMKNAHLSQLQQQDNNRFEKFSINAAGLTLDYSNNHCDQTTLQLLTDLAQACKLEQSISDLFQGVKVNRSENQPALHTALRHVSAGSLRVDGEEVIAKIQAVWARMEAISHAVRCGQYVGFSGQPIKHIVNIGIGGSDLGPKMAACALGHLVQDNLHFHYVSNLDANDLQTCLRDCEPETTLFIVSSKSFTTHETLSNLTLAKQWLTNAAGTHQSIAKQLIAVTANVDKAKSYGFEQEYILPFWYWVGGRYSIWSAVSLSLAIAIGMDGFKQFLAGAHSLDQHFQTAPFASNMPVILGLLRVWVNNFFNHKTQAVIVYNQVLQYFPDYLQQLFMESLGKRVTNDDGPVDYDTGGILWGGVGTNTQHSFHQLLLQGTQTVPTEFVFSIKAASDQANHEEMIANCLAQSEVFCHGFESEDEVAKSIEGNIPHSLIMLDEMSPFCLGALIALYEHKAFVQSVIWGINPFDQWGVQRGKVIMPTILEKIRNSHSIHQETPSNLISLIARRMHE